jgi:hypothetical protein
MRRSRRERVAFTILVATACAPAADDPAGSTSSMSPSSASASTSIDTLDSTATSGDPTEAADTTASDTTTTSNPPATLSLARVAGTFPIPSLAASTPKRFADVTYDPISDVYLAVNGNVAISGTFLSGDAAIVSDAFAIADLAYSQGCRVAFGSASFLVAWHDNRTAPNVARVRARRVTWDGAPQLGPDVEVSTTDSYSEMPPAISWSASSETYLVAWHTAAGDDIHAQRVSVDGTPLGPPLPITADADWQSDAGIAWNPDRDEWLVVYTHAGATVEVRGRTVLGDGAGMGNEVTIATAKGTWLAQAAYDTTTGDYLVAWFDGRMAARTLAPDGSPTSDAFELATGFGSYDGFAIAHDPTTGFFAAVFHGTTDEDFAIAFDAAGNQTEPIEATSSRGTDGNFNPRIAARHDGEWLVVTSRGFAEIVGQRLGP